MNNYSFLAEHFGFKFFDIKSNDPLVGEMKKYYAEINFEHWQDYQHAAAFIEKKSGDAILFDISNNSFDYDCYGFYLKQLPSLKLSDVAFFFTLLQDGTFLKDAIFKIPDNYPSTFAKEILKETYGNVVYSHQLLLLLASCLPKEEVSHKQLNEYRKDFGLRRASFFEKLENLFLPDGCNLGELLRQYTPRKIADCDFGFVTLSTHKLAFDFIQKAKKYL
jgi:hypothetical protein